MCYFFHAFGTINSLPKGSKDSVDLAERMAILENMMFNHRFDIWPWHDEHHGVVTDKSIPHPTRRINEMESRIQALENTVNDQELIIVKLRSFEEQSHSLRKTVADLKFVLMEYDIRFKELENKLGEQEIIIGDLKQNMFENDRHETLVNYPTDDVNVVVSKLNNSNDTAIIDRKNYRGKEIPNTGNKDNEKGGQR
jgi:uncharacterized coiled-coil protein SlyX